jgi:hypothetical protein
VLLISGDAHQLLEAELAATEGLFLLRKPFSFEVVRRARAVDSIRRILNVELWEYSRNRRRTVAVENHEWLRESVV